MDNDTNDTLGIERKKTDVVLDTIINLSKRKMIVFDKCLNGLLFNQSVELKKER